MIKRLGILLVICCMVQIAHAQKNRWFNVPFSEEYYEGHFIHVGINYTLYQNRFLVDLKQPLDSTLSNPAQLGLGTGISVNLTLHKNLQLHFNPTLIVYQQQYLNYSDSTHVSQKFFQREKDNPMSLEMPMRVRLKSNPKFYNNKRNYYKMYLLGGGKWNHDIGYKNTINQYISDNKVDVLYTKPNYFSLETGVGIEFFFTYFKLNPEIRFSQTVHNIHYPNNPSLLNDAMNKLGLRSLQFSIILE
jgi:hypothetical protein